MASSEFLAEQQRYFHASCSTPLYCFPAESKAGHTSPTLSLERELQEGDLGSPTAASSQRTANIASHNPTR